jgi:hypothetical protein
MKKERRKMEKESSHNNPSDVLFGTIGWLRENIVKLLTQIGDKGKCRGCGAEIYWVTHKNGKKAPYTSSGLNHFADCPKAGDFKK